MVVDEAQDCSACILGIVEALRCARVLAFDRHQNIMQFQHVHSAGPLRRFPATFQKALPSSRRFGPLVAQLLTRFVEAFKPGANMRIVGDPGKATRVQLVESLEAAFQLAVDEDRQVVAVGRKNSSLFDAAVAAVLGEFGPVAFLGGKKKFQDDVLSVVQDIAFLAEGKYDKIKDSFVQRYAKPAMGFDKFRFVVEKQQMTEYLTKLEMYDTYGSDLRKMMKRVWAQVIDDTTAARVVLTTTHKARVVEFLH